MNFLRIPFLVIFSFIIFSCDTNSSSDENEVEGVEDPVEQDPNDDDSDEITFTVVNAFPNLSFSQPLDLQVATNESNRIYVAEKGGEIKVFDNDSSVTEVETFLDLGSIATSSEQGLLGLAFHPNFQSNGHFYVHYTPRSDVAFVSRFTVAQATTNLADVNSELVILEIPQPQTNHNGGQIAFGPDGYLYIGVGDGGGG